MWPARAGSLVHTARIQDRRRICEPRASRFPCPSSNRHGRSAPSDAIPATKPDASTIKSPPKAVSAGGPTRCGPVRSSRLLPVGVVRRLVSAPSVRLTPQPCEHRRNGAPREAFGDWTVLPLAPAVHDHSMDQSILRRNYQRRARTSTATRLATPSEAGYALCQRPCVNVRRLATGWPDHPHVRRVELDEADHHVSPVSPRSKPAPSRLSEPCHRVSQSLFGIVAVCHLGHRSCSELRGWSPISTPMRTSSTTPGRKCSPPTRDRRPRGHCHATLNSGAHCRTPLGYQVHSTHAAVTDPDRMCAENASRGRRAPGRGWGSRQPMLTSRDRPRDPASDQRRSATSTRQNRHGRGDPLKAKRPVPVVGRLTLADHPRALDGGRNWPHCLATWILRDGCGGQAAASPGDSCPNTSTRFRPFRLATYIALSAFRRTSSERSSWSVL